MIKDTLDGLEATQSVEIIPVESQNSPKYRVYMTALDRVFRRDGSDMLEAIGFICYVSLDRPYGSPQPRGKVDMNFFAGKSMDHHSVKDLADAEVKLSISTGKGPIWKSYLKGQRHDYYFYSRVNIEDTLDLLDVAEVMIS